MKNLVFVKPALETDAVWDPIRTCSYLGMWYLASQLKSKGHNVSYLDEVVRNKGISKRSLFRREIEDNKITEIPLDQTYEEFSEQKMHDYNTLSPKNFVEKYSAFQHNGKVSRTMVRTGNSLEDTLSKIEELNPEVIGIPLIASANYLPATRLAREIKAKFPKIRMIFGGQAISADPEGFIKENPYVDQVVTGDAISVIDDVINRRRTKKIVCGGFRTMNQFPILDPSIIEDTGYPLEPTYTYPTTGRKSVDFMFSKGCFRRCDFCVAGSQKGDYISAIDYERIDQQLAEFKKHGVEELIIQDDAFLHDPKHRREYLPKILSLMKKYGFYWQNNGGIEFEGIDDFVTEQLIKYNQEGEGRVTALYVPFNPRSWNKEQSAAKSMSSRYHQNAAQFEK